MREHHTMYHLRKKKSRSRFLTARGRNRKPLISFCNFACRRRNAGCRAGVDAPAVRGAGDRDQAERGRGEPLGESDTGSGCAQASAQTGRDARGISRTRRRRRLRIFAHPRSPCGRGRREPDAAQREWRLIHRIFDGSIRSRAAKLVCARHGSSSISACAGARGPSGWGE